MRKIILSALLSSGLVFAADLQTKGVEVTYTDSNDDEKTVVIKRVKDEKCSKVDFSPKTILGGDYAGNGIPKECKKTFVTSYGKISPMKFDEKVDTYGELEVLEFIKKAKTNENMLLVDSRTENWYMQKTIASAINIPFIYLNKTQYPEEFADALDTIGVKVTKDGYDFSQAKELLLFCNAAWCAQSPISMEKLIKLGYPKEKLNWYRGGIQSWLTFNLPTIEP